MQRRLKGIVVKRARPETGRVVRGAENGFTLIELLATMGLATILLVMGAFAARQFWFQRSLVGGRDQIVAQLRALQQQTVAEGVTTRYYGAWFDEGTEDWGTVVTNSATCTSQQSFELDAGVVVNSVDTTADATAAAQVAACRTAIGRGDAEFVFFLPRGIATETNGPDHIELIQPRFDDRTRNLRVLGLTGRVEAF